MTTGQKKRNVFIIIGIVVLLIAGFFVVKQILKNALMKEYEQACLAMAEPMAQAINAKDADAFNSFVNYTVFAGIISGKEVNDQEAKDILDTLHKYSQVALFAQNLIDEGGHFKFMNYYFDGNYGHLIFRLFTNYGAIYYYDYQIVKTDAGFKAVKYYNITTSSPVEMRAMEMMPVSPTSDELVCEVLKQEMKEQNNILKRVKDYRDLHQVVRATRELDLLDKKLMSTYLYHHEYMKIISASGTPQYMKYAKLRQTQTDNPLYIAIYKFYEKIGTESAEQILSAIDEFEHSFGKDEILGYFSAFAKMQKGEHKIALEELILLNEKYEHIFIFKLAIFSCHFEMDAENAVENFKVQMNLPGAQMLQLLEKIAKYIPFEVKTVAADKGLK